MSAIVSDGSITYFHDESGTDHEIGGCQSFFRGVDHETYVRVTYRLRVGYSQDMLCADVSQRLTVAMEVDGKGWKECFSVPDVIIPTTYKLAVTAATGDLADNHDILSIKVNCVEHEAEANVTFSSPSPSLSPLKRHSLTKSTEPPRLRQHR